MPFDLLDKPLVYIPVKWPGVGEGADGEAVAVEHTIDVQIELLDREEFADWIKSGMTELDGTEAAAHELATFKRVAKGWRKIKAGKNAVEFNDENIARLLLFPGFVGAFGAAYMAAWQGQIETREGNSGGSPANGPAGGPTDETPKAATSATSPSES